MAKNLKILLSGDSKPFRQEIEKSKTTMQGFQTSTTSALDKMAQAFGVNTSGIKSTISGTNSALKGMGTSFKGAAVGSGVLSGALKVLKLALISTGIGAIVVLLGTLVSYFTKTQRGADKVSVVFKAIGAVVDVLIDRLSGFGEGLYLLVTGKFKEGADKLKESFKGIGAEMLAEGSAAAQLEKDYQALQDAEIELSVTKSERRKEINALRLAAEDETKSIQEQANALKKARDIELQSMADERALEEERIRIISERISLGESMRGDVEELANARVKLNELESSSLQLQRRLTNEINTVTTKLDAQTDAVRKNAQAKADAERATSTSLTSIDGGALDYTAGGQIPGIELAVPDMSGQSDAAEQMQGIWINAASTVNGAMANMAVGFGESIGQMIAGTAGAEQIGQTIITALADMAIQVGQIAIGAGLAKMGIDTALVTFGGGGLAVAAGAALVALGTAVKSSMAAAATGSAGASSGISGSSISGGSKRTEAQKVQIEVNGTLTGKGSTLQAILNSNTSRLKTV